MSNYNIRAVCAEITMNVVENGQSLTTALYALKNVKDKDRALTQEIVYGVLRALPELEFYVQHLMDRVLVKKNRIVHHLILVGLYQICHTRIPIHAALSETVEATVVLNKVGFKKVVNGVLRQFSRQKESLFAEFQKTEAKLLHPKWLIERLKTAYPNEWKTILEQNNLRPPMWIRLNEQKIARDDYLNLLKEGEIDYLTSDELACAIQIVSPVPVHNLPLFAEGVISVQDISAQKAAYLVDPKMDELILDLCAAPGGKTTHLLELEPTIKLTAVDLESSRLQKIQENLTRLNQKATLIVGDGLKPENWIENQLFDKILIDAPCSATGVIRRHPDIKWLRKNNDIAKLVEIQKEMLNKIWKYLKPNGNLVYATCSILPEENQLQINHFLTQHPDAILVGSMHQLLPKTNGGDGFFYAQIKKLA